MFLGFRARLGPFLMAKKKQQGKNVCRGLKGNAPIKTGYASGSGGPEEESKTSIFRVDTYSVLKGSSSSKASFSAVSRLSALILWVTMILTS